MKTSLKARAKKLKSEITAIYYAYKDPGTGLFPKLIILICLGYALSPVDLIPDFIPVLGYVDDLLLLPLLVGLSIKLINPKVMAEARRRAIDEPLNLKKNWIAAALIIMLWFSVIIYISIRLINRP